MAGSVTTATLSLQSGYRFVYIFGPEVRDRVSSSAYLGPVWDHAATKRSWPEKNFAGKSSYISKRRTPNR